MKTLAVIFVLALITIAFEIYSDAALTSAEVSHTSVPDPATAAIVHALKTRLSVRKQRHHVNRESSAPVCLQRWTLGTGKGNAVCY